MNRKTAKPRKKLAPFFGRSWLFWLLPLMFPVLTCTASVSGGRNSNDGDFQSKSSDAVARLKEFLVENELSMVAGEEFASIPLTLDDARRAVKILKEKRHATILQDRKAEMENRSIKLDDLEMPFWYQVYGENPKQGRSLFISMHGGGGAPKRVNDRQWQNQKRLYQPEEGVYVAPRAPTDTWNLWHQAHIDRFFDRLIENLVVFESVNPNRVYLMGYSAGGDGAYQLAPRMADRWAAVSMMAGHPNDTSPLGLRNIAFAIFMGGNDRAYKRNEVAAEWKEKLAELRREDESGYRHQVTIYPNKGHWMDREDASAIPWMAKFVRDPFPSKIVWYQDDVTHKRFYWLASANPKRADKVVAEMSDNEIKIETKLTDGLSVRLSDEFVAMDNPIRIVVNGKQVANARAPRTINVMVKTLLEAGISNPPFYAEIAVGN